MHGNNIMRIHLFRNIIYVLRDVQFDTDTFQRYATLVANYIKRQFFNEIHISNILQIKNDIFKFK